MSKLVVKGVLPLVVLGLGVLGAWAVVASKPLPQKHSRAKTAPLVEVIKIALKDIRVKVRASGVVQPRTTTQLSAEVAGKVVYVSDSVAAGGFFAKGEVLFKLDPTDYEVAVVQAKGALAKAELELTLVAAEAKSSREEFARLKRTSRDPDPLVLKKPHLAEARAAVDAAKAALAQARANLARTVMKAPYAGRVSREYADVGQYVAKGFKMADIFAVDFAEVRLPLADRKLEFLDLPVDYRNGRGDQPKPAVAISARFAGRDFSWQGKIVRTEGELDPKSRMVIAVAQVADPYGRGDQPGRPPLGSGMYVRAEIAGRLYRQVAVLPRGALRGAGLVLVVDSGSRMHFRRVRVLKTERDRVIIDQGLKAGDLVSITQPEVVVEGMPVKVVGPAAKKPAAGRPGPASKKGAAQ